MTKYVCPECGGNLVQMLEREPWDDRPDGFQQVSTKHYGFYCKKCKIMFKEKFHLVRDEEVS